MSLSFRRLRYLSYELINRVKIRLGSVARRPINTNPGLTFNLRFFVYQFKSIFEKKFPVFFQNIQSSNWSSKRFKLNFLSKLLDLKSYFTLTLGYLNPALNNKWILGWWLGTWNLMNLSRFLCNTLTSINLKQRHLRGFRAILPQKRHILAALQERFENILGIIKSVKFLVPLDMRNWYAGDNRYEIWVLSASVRVGRDTPLCVICSFRAEYEIKWAGFFFHLWTLHILGS